LNRLIGIRFQLDDVSALREVSLETRCSEDVSGLTEYLRPVRTSFFAAGTIQLRQAPHHYRPGFFTSPKKLFSMSGFSVVCRSHFMPLPAASQHVDYIATGSTTILRLLLTA